jgi:hypothetical protein
MVWTLSKPAWMHTGRKSSIALIIALLPSLIYSPDETVILSIGYMKVEDLFLLSNYAPPTSWNGTEYTCQPLRLSFSKWFNRIDSWKSSFCREQPRALNLIWRLRLILVKRMHINPWKASRHRILIFMFNSNKLWPLRIYKDHPRESHKSSIMILHQKNW